MKRLSLTSIVALPLVLTACSSEPKPQSFADVNAILEAVDKPMSPIQCQKTEQRESPLIFLAETQGSCMDQNGAEANLLVFDDQANLDARIGQAMQRDTWAEGEWLILRGENWTVDCKSLQQCELWKEAIGGEILGANA